MARLILAEQGRTFVIAVTSVMVSIPTIIVIMLAAAVVVAGLLWTEWGHR